MAPPIPPFPFTRTCSFSVASFFFSSFSVGLTGHILRMSWSEVRRMFGAQNCVFLLPIQSSVRSNRSSRFFFRRSFRTRAALFSFSDVPLAGSMNSWSPVFLLFTTSLFERWRFPPYQLLALSSYQSWLAYFDMAKKA